MGVEVTGTVSILGPPSVEVQKGSQNHTSELDDDNMVIKVEQTQLNVEFGGPDALNVESSFPIGTPASLVEDLTFGYNMSTGDLESITGDTSNNVVTLVRSITGELSQVVDGFSMTTIDFTYAMNGDLTNLTFT